jgi:hypothetical protein
MRWRGHVKQQIRRSAIGLALVVLVTCARADSDAEPDSLGWAYLPVDGGTGSIAAAVGTEVGPHPSPLLPETAADEETWMIATVAFENLSRDTVRLSFADTGCTIRLSMHARSQRDGRPVWIGPRGCADIELAPRLLPGERFTFPAYLIPVSHILGDSLAPGRYHFAAELELGVARRGSDGFGAVVEQTASALNAGTVVLPR